MKRKLAVIVALGLGAGAVSAGFAIAAGGDEQPLTGSQLGKATDAALAHTGGGTVVETEADSDDVPYSVEVRLDNGRVVEVEVDENFDVVGEETDDDAKGEDESGNDDPANQEESEDED
jgi:hypothetical protein